MGYQIIIVIMLIKNTGESVKVRGTKSILSGLSLRFQVAGYLLLVAGEVAKSQAVIQKAFLPQKSNLHQEYSYH